MKYDITNFEEFARVFARIPTQSKTASIGSLNPVDREPPITSLEKGFFSKAREVDAAPITTEKANDRT